MRAPKVSQRLLRAMNTNAKAQLTGRARPADVLRAVPDRAPLGLMVNALPAYYLVQRPDKSLWLMQDKSRGESTGAQVCLCVIPASVVAAAQASRTPLVLEAK